MAGRSGLFVTLQVSQAFAALYSQNACVCGCLCVCVCARALRIVFRDKILRFKNTFIIIIIIC